jgi:hypothetical protein
MPVCRLVQSTLVGSAEAPNMVDAETAMHRPASARGPMPGKG